MNSECDCCGKMAKLTRCWPMGMETFACAECRHEDPEDYEDFVECWQCGGLGATAGCFEDCCSGADCDPDDAETCCSPRRCDVCKGKGGWPPDEEKESDALTTGQRND